MKQPSFWAKSELDGASGSPRNNGHLRKLLGKMRGYFLFFSFFLDECSLLII